MVVVKEEAQRPDNIFNVPPLIRHMDAAQFESVVFDCIARTPRKPALLISTAVLSAPLTDKVVFLTNRRAGIQAVLLTER